MKTKIIAEGAERVFAVIFDKGEEVIQGLTDFAEERNLTGSHFTAIGAFESAVLAYFDRERKDYKQIPLDEQMEVLVLAGDIALKEGKPQVHAHTVLGRSDGSAWGGHLLQGRVWPTLEVVIHESPSNLRRFYDQETKLALIDPSFG
jgi:predicted DNA-binding protein with PD1-like motif